MSNKLSKLNPFAKPTEADLRAKELEAAKTALYQAEIQVDYYINQINYYKTRIEKLEIAKTLTQNFAK